SPARQFQGRRRRGTMRRRSRLWRGARGARRAKSLGARGAPSPGAVPRPGRCAPPPLPAPPRGEKPPRWAPRPPRGGPPAPTRPAEMRLGDSIAPGQIAELRSGGTLTADLGEENLNSERNPYHARAVLLSPCLLGEQLVGLLTIDYASEPHDYTPDEIALAGA